MSNYFISTVSVVLIVFHGLCISVSGSSTQVNFLDVGQGDATFINIDDLNILVDGSDGDQVLHKLSKYMKFKERKIDYIILSHPHADHMNGLLDILERYDVGEILMNPVCYKSLVYEKLLKYEKKISYVYSGLEIENESFKIKFLAPERSTSTDCDSTGYIANRFENINDESVVFQLEINGVKTLFMGDAEQELEDELISIGKLEDIDILKAGHHCSNTSSSLKFLELVKPELVICSCGKENRYGHPGKETVKNFKVLGIPYLLTWEESDIELTFNLK